MHGFGALTTAVSGLMAQSRASENISADITCSRLSADLLKGAQSVSDAWLHANGRETAPASGILMQRFTLDGAASCSFDLNSGPTQFVDAGSGINTNTPESGQPIFAGGGRNVIGGMLEGSNAGIADEFSKMIVTPQAYSANTRTITTAQQMLQDVKNIVQ